MLDRFPKRSTFGPMRNRCCSLAAGFLHRLQKKALKLMELAYIPCLAYPAGEMKHGPIALLEEGSPVVVVAPNDHLKEKTLSALHECRARGAKIIPIHEKGDPIGEEGDVSRYLCLSDSPVAYPVDDGRSASIDGV